MNQAALNNVQLDYLARHDPVLGPRFPRRVCQESITQQPHHHSTSRVPCQPGSCKVPQDTLGLPSGRTVNIANS